MSSEPTFELPRKPAQRKRSLRRGFLLFALCAALGTLGFVKGGQFALYRLLDPILTPIHGSNPPAPTVVFMVLDNVRADHLSLCGYPRPTSPFLESLASETTCTCTAQAPGSWTLPSHASYFTGQPHAALHDNGFTTRRHSFLRMDVAPRVVAREIAMQATPTVDARWDHAG
jgi:hypothetical protein